MSEVRTYYKIQSYYDPSASQSAGKRWCETSSAPTGVYDPDNEHVWLAYFAYLKLVSETPLRLVRVDVKTLETVVNV